MEWMPMVRRMTGIAALVLAAEVVVNVVLQFLILQPIIDVVGAEFYHWTFTGLYWLGLLASVLIVIGLVTGWRLDRPAWGPGVGQLVAGTAVLWGWRLLNRFADIWGYSRLTEEQLARVPTDEQLVWMGWASTITSIAIDLVAIAFLVLGARKLLRSGQSRTAAVR